MRLCNSYFNLHCGTLNKKARQSAGDGSLREPTQLIICLEMEFSESKVFQALIPQFVMPSDTELCRICPTLCADCKPDGVLKSRAFTFYIVTRSILINSEFRKCSNPFTFYNYLCCRCTVADLLSSGAVIKSNLWSRILIIKNILNWVSQTGTMFN